MTKVTNILRLIVKRGFSLADKKKNTYKSEKEKELKRKLDEELKTMPDFVREYMVAKSISRSPSTLYAYFIDMRVFLSFIKERDHLQMSLADMGLDILGRVKPRDILEYRDYLSNTNSLVGIKRKFSSLSAVYTYFCKTGALSSNPVRAVDMPKISQKRVEVLKDNEIERIFDAIETGSSLSENARKRFHESTKYRDMAIVALLLSSGVRLSELVGLDIRDIDFDHPEEDSSGNVIYEAYVSRKGGNEDRIYHMETNRKEMLKGKTDEDEPALFLSLRGNRLSEGSVEALIKKHAMTAVPTKNVHPHMFRKTRGTRIYNETNDLKLTAAILGDKSVEVVSIHYVAGNEQNRKDAANIGKLRKRT